MPSSCAGLPSRLAAALAFVLIPLGLLLAGCVRPRAAVSRPSPGGLTLDLTVRLRPEGVSHALHLGPGGRGEVRTTRVAGYAEIEEDPVLLTRTPVLALALEGIFDDLSRLPRWAHTPSSFTGVAVELRARLGEEEVVFDGFNAGLPPIASLARVLRERGGEPVAPLAVALEGLERYRGRETWTYTPDETPPQRLLEPLDPPFPDAELRHLALDILAREGRDEFVPRLRRLYTATVPPSPAGSAAGPPDYYLALALLRLGDPVGLDRVVEVARSAHPRWSSEAAGALEALFGEAYGESIGSADSGAAASGAPAPGPPVPGAPASGAPAPGPAVPGAPAVEDAADRAIEAFLQWWHAEAARLVYDRKRRIYRRSP